jgi:hypothetical protein
MVLGAYISEPGIVKLQIAGSLAYALSSEGLRVFDIGNAAQYLLAQTTRRKLG